MIKVFLIVLFADVCQCAVTVTPQEEFVTQGTSLTIIATTDEAAVTWTYKSGLSLSLCSISSSFCLNPNVDNMVLSADASTNTTTITISAVNCSINTALYTATTSFGVATANIVVTTPASSLDVTTSLSMVKVSTQELSFVIPCVHPQPVANFTITRQGYPDETINDVTVTRSNSGCQCAENTYTITKTITASNYPNEVVNVTANVDKLSPVLIGSVYFTVIVLAVLLSISALIFIVVYGLLTSNGTVAPCVLHCLRYYNRKKGISPVSQMKLLAKHGDTVVLEIDRLHIIDFNCQRLPGIIEPDFINGEDKLSFSIPITSDDDYGVYQVDILIDCSQRQSDAKYNYHVIPGSSTTKNDDQKGRECTFLVKFQWDKEDLVSIQYPAAYFFADKYFLNGVKFTGIQIIIGAAISQLIALIAVSIVLPVVYFGHKKYDICIGVIVSCALAIAFSLLGLLVYLLTVVFICRRNLKSKDGKGHPGCRRTFLLFVMLPVALLVSIGIFIINICGGGKDKCGNEEQGTKEKIKMSTGKKGLLPPITATLNGTDEQNEKIRKKKKPKKDKKAKQITNSPENIIHPMEIQNAEQLSEEMVQPCITDLK